MACCAISSSQAEPPLGCTVCNDVLSGQFVWLDGPGVGPKKAVCMACSELKTVCFVCRLPVKNGFETLKDGRIICSHDNAAAITSQRQADESFHETKRDLMRILAGSGALPERNIKLALADRIEIDRLYRPEARGHAKTSSIMGLTSSGLVKNDEWEHTIYVLDHLPPARFAAVCAHEYAHAWIHENVRKGRSLDADSVEGFCEWISYKMMKERNEAIEIEMILANQYTRGQVDALIKADQHVRSYDLIKWIKDGADSKVDSENTSRVLKLDKQDAASPLWITTAPPPPAPATLTLRGISGNAARRFALINDCTLQKNEIGKVRVGASNVVVQCLAITTNSVIVRVRGSNQNTELFLTKR